VQSTFGWPEHEWIGQPWSMLFAAGSGDAQALLARARADPDGGAPLEGRLRRRDGSDFAAAISLTRADAGEGGAHVGFVAFASDLTRVDDADALCRKLLEAEREARAEAERRAAELDAALENIPDAVYIGDEGGITRCNARALDMLGASSIEELRRPIGELGERFQVRHLKQGRLVEPHELPFVRALQGEPSVLETWTTHAASGEPVYVRGAAAPIVIDGRIAGAVAVNSDLTRSRRLQDEHRRLSQIVEHSGELMLLATPSGELVYFNRAGRELIGLKDDVLPASLIELFAISDRPRIEQETIPALQRGERWSGEVELRHQQSTAAIPVSWSAFPVRDEDAEHPLVWACIGHDLTRTKRIESALSERDQQFKALLNGVRDYAIFVIGPDGLIASWHEGARRMKGYTADEAIGMPFENLFVPEDREAGRAQLEMQIAASTGEFTGEGVRQRKDGSHFDALVVLTATRGPDGELLGYLKLTQDITLRKRREAEREQLLRVAQAARDEAERANRMKNDFLATISHELRTPLGAILGWSRLLERGVHDAEGVQHGLAAISRNAANQSKLIDDLLDMARIESGTLRLELAPVEVAGVISAGVEATAPAAAAKRIALRTNIDPHTPPVMADAQRLQQVVWNLLSNAIKFSPEGGNVTVSARPAGMGAEIVVSDNGQGIPASFLPHVFDRFRQHDSSITRRQGGLGLGLSIVKQLVELHGGRVRAESAGEQRGASFFVELPAASPNPTWRDGRRGRAAMSAETKAASGRLLGVKVLIVDDEPDAREVAKEVLQEAGASVIEARDASEGLEALKRHRPDALLSDVGMPIHDGFEFISWVRRLAPDQGGTTPAAAITAYASAEDHERAMRSGFQIHVAKPLEFDTWIATVERLLSRAPHR
ncbi:partial two-component system, NarL family, sensor histidine kinase EvgS, partial [Burkholderiaceae bacterium]